MTRVFKTMREEWGCTYFKLDANFWGAMHGGRFHDPRATRIEAYRRGMQAILRGSGDGFILGCNHPIWPSTGLIHGSRSSNDIKRTWDRIATTARQNLSRNWQNGRLWWNDPDAVVLASDLTDIECQFHATAIYATGGMVLSGDDLTKLPPARAAMLRKLLPPSGVAATFDDATLRVGVVTVPAARMMCFFNWDDRPQTLVGAIACTGGRHRLLDRRITRTPAGRPVTRDGAAIGAPAEGGLVIVSDQARAGGTRATATAFAALFAVVGLSLYGLPLYYDFMVRELGWYRTMVTSGNAISKLIVGPLFGFAAGWIVDRFGPRRLMMTGIVMAGGALVGLGAVSAASMFYFFYFFNALGLRLRRAAAEPGAAVAMVRSDARQGDGHRVSRDRHRRRDRAAAGELDDRPARMARVAAGARRADRPDRVSAGVLRPRGAGGD